MKKNNLLIIGKFVNTHGIKGEIRLILDFDYFDLLKINKEIFIKDVSNSYKIISKRRHKNFVLLKLENIVDINQIEFLKNSFVFLEREDEKKYIPDFIGYKVFNKKKLVGIVIGYFKQGNNYSLEVNLEDNKKTNIPFLDDFISEVKDNKIYIKDKFLF